MQSNLKLWHLLLMAFVMIVHNLVFVWLVSQMSPGAMFDYMVFGYDQVDYRSNLYRLGETGLNVYKYKVLPLDMVYPFVYATTALIAWEMVVKARNRRLYWIGGVLMVAGVFLDYGENARLGLMLFEIVPPSASNVATTSHFTMAKWGIIVLFVMMLLVMTLVNRSERRNANSGNSPADPVDSGSSRV